MFAFLIACSSQTILPATDVQESSKPADSTADTYPCDETVTPLTADEPGLSGLSANEVYGPFLGDHEATFVYADGTETPIHLSLEVLDAEDIHVIPSGDGTTACGPSHQTARISGHLWTDDGAFDVSAHVSGPVDALVDSFYYGPYIAPADNLGTYVDPEMTELSVVANVFPDHISGELVSVRGIGECGIGAYGMDLMTGC